MRRPNLRRIRGTFAFVVCALVTFGCMPEPVNPARLECFRGCARQKDACILAATNADALQGCDGQSQACGEQCPQ